MRTLCLVVGLLLACDPDPTSASSDAGPCEDGSPGLRVRFIFEPDAPLGGPAWSPQTEELAVTWTGASAQYPAPGTMLDAESPGVFHLPVPAGALPGPGSLFFYSIAGLTNFEGQASFEGDPTRCVDARLPVATLDIGGVTGTPHSCVDSMLVILELPDGEALGGPAELTIMHADGTIQDLSARLPPPPWNGVLFVRGPRPENVEGQATATFSSAEWTGMATTGIDQFGCVVWQLAIEPAGSKPATPAPR